MDTKSAGIGSQGGDASEPATEEAEGFPGGRPASAAPDVAACTPDASPGPAPSSSSERRAGAAGIAPTPALPRMTPEAALRSALGICDYILRHWAEPGGIGDMPSVASTRDDVIAGLLACEAKDYGVPPRPTRLAETHARLSGLATGHGSRCLGVLIWDHEDRGGGGPTHRVEWSATVFARGSSERIIARGSSEDPEDLLSRISAALATAATPDPEPDVIALGDLPGVTP